jgi:hypothetical protein
LPGTYHRIIALANFDPERLGASARHAASSKSAKNVSSFDALFSGRVCRRYTESAFCRMAAGMGMVEFHTMPPDSSHFPHEPPGPAEARPARAVPGRPMSATIEVLGRLVEALGRSGLPPITPLPAKSRPIPTAPPPPA